MNISTTTFPLTERDRHILKQGIKFKIFLSGLIFLGMLILIAVIVAIIYSFKENIAGVFSGSLDIVAITFIFCIMTIVLSCYKDFIDLRKNDKLKIITNHHNISYKKDGIVLSIPNRKDITITEEISSSIKEGEELTIEITKYGNELLFISHNEINLYD